MEMKTGAAIGGLLIVGAGVAGWLSTQNRQQELRQQRVEVAEQAPASAAASLDPIWDWVGRVGWPVLEAHNVACRPVNHCRDLPGNQRARCFAEGIPRCEAALHELQSVVAEGPESVVQLFEFNAVQTEMGLCVYRQNLLAHVEHPELIDAVSAPVSSEEVIGEVASGRGGEALAEIASAISECLSSEPSERRGTGSTQRTLRERFGCCTGAGCVPVCCTPEIVAAMVAGGIAPLSPDAACL